MNIHTCIKPACGNSYESQEEEAYYCPSCVKEKAAIARKIDAQMANRAVKKKIVSDFQIMQEKGQSRGQATFVRAADLDINF